MASDLGQHSNAVAIYQASQAIYDLFDCATVLYQGRQIYLDRPAMLRVSLNGRDGIVRLGRPRETFSRPSRTLKSVRRDKEWNPKYQELQKTLKHTGVVQQSFKPCKRPYTPTRKSFKEMSRAGVLNNSESKRIIGSRSMSVLDLRTS